MKGKRNKFSHSNSFLNYSGTENISNWHLDQASVDEILLSKFEQQHKNRMTAVKKRHSEGKIRSFISNMQEIRLYSFTNELDALILWIE